MVAYLLVLTKVMGNWWLVLATGVIALALPALGRAVRPEAFRAALRSPLPTCRRSERVPAAGGLPIDGLHRGRGSGRCPPLRSRGLACPSAAPRC